MVGITTTATTSASSREMNRARQLALDPQPAPRGTGPEVLPLVLHDLERYEVGRDGHEAMRLLQIDLEARVSAKSAEYGTSLRVNNGRNPLIDAYQEAMDTVMFMRQHVTETEGDGYWIYQGAINLAHRIRMAVLRRDGW